MDEGQEPKGTGEPVTERARIAGVEAGIAAGLVPSTEAVARPRTGPGETATASVTPDLAGQVPGAPAAVEVLADYELPDWTDPPTLQVPRVLLDLEQEAAGGRAGPLAAPPGGPVWRERQEDWNDSDSVLADLATGGVTVTAYEESSSDDPFAYDFLDDSNEAAWIARNEPAEQATPPPRVAVPAPPAEASPAVEVSETLAEPAEVAEADTVLDDSEESVAARVRRRRHVARRPRRPAASRSRREPAASRPAAILSLPPSPGSCSPASCSCAFSRGRRRFWPWWSWP